MQSSTAAVPVGHGLQLADNLLLVQVRTPALTLIKTWYLDRAERGVFLSFWYNTI